MTQQSHAADALVARIVEHEIVEPAARRMATEALADATDMRSVKRALRAIDEIKQYAGLDDALRTRKADLDAMLTRLRDESYARQMSEPPRRPRVQMWDDDAPGGVVYE